MISLARKFFTNNGCMLNLSTDIESFYSEADQRKEEHAERERKKEREKTVRKGKERKKRDCEIESNQCAPVCVCVCVRERERVSDREIANFGATIVHEKEGRRTKE